MDQRSANSAAPRVKKSRSRVACKRCHDRRIKCDVEKAGIPCSSCREVDLGSCCQVINSRRRRGDDGRFHGRIGSSVMQPVSIATPSSSRDPSNRRSESRDPSGQPLGPSEGPQLTPSAQSSATEADVWSKVVSHDHSRPVDGRRVLYVGEPWTLAYVMQWKGGGREATRNEELLDGNLAVSPQGVHVQVPVENTASPPTVPIPGGSGSTISSHTDLSPRVQEDLINSYFTRNHRLYPILNQERFRGMFRKGTISTPLALAVFYAAALHVPDPVIYRAGFDDRKTCLISLYRRAKAAFFSHDDDGTVDQLSYIQAAFLLHNMWQGPNATMDPWTWLGLAIRMAQNIGMHRSTRHSSLPKAEQQLWKRMWWCLHTRDRQISSALGKPLMIRDEDCDVEFLSVDDFEEGDAKEMKLFVVEQAKLSVLYGLVISSLFTVQPCERSTKEEARRSLIQQLDNWRQTIPQELQFSDRRNGGLLPLCLPSMLLEVLYNCLLLLIHRSYLKATDNQAEVQASFNTSLQAARGITQITQMIMNYGALTDCPLFFTSALFGAMTIHATRGMEGEQELNLCMIAMRSLSTMYFAAGWIRNLFCKLTEKRSASRRTTRPSSPNPTSSQVATHSNGESQHLGISTEARGLDVEYPRDDSLEWSGATSVWQGLFTGELGMGGFQAQMPGSEDQGQLLGDVNPFEFMNRSLGEFINYSLLNDVNFN